MSRYEKLMIDEFDALVRDHDNKLFDIMGELEHTIYTAPKRIDIVGEKTIFGIAKSSGYLNDNGFSQLCAKLNAPASWLSSGKCPEDLEETIINRMKSEYKGDELFFRFRNVADNLPPVIRAVLSKQYMPYDNLPFWNAVKDSLIGTGLANMNPVIWKPDVGDYMSVWILFENVTTPPPEKIIKLYDGGDVTGLKPAIHIRNAEDGTGSLRIDSGFYRGYCTNGVIFGFKTQNETALRQIHKGSQFNFVTAKIKLAIAEAAQYTVFGIEKFLESTDIYIKQDVLNEVVDLWTKKFSIAVSDTRELKTNFSQVRTWADAVMVVSDYAGTKVNSNESYMLENMAGEMLLTGANKNFIERR